MTRTLLLMVAATAMLAACERKTAEAPMAAPPPAATTVPQTPVTAAPENVTAKTPSVQSATTRIDWDAARADMQRTLPESQAPDFGTAAAGGPPP